MTAGIIGSAPQPTGSSGLTWQWWPSHDDVLGYDSGTYDNAIYYEGNHG